MRKNRLWLGVIALLSLTGFNSAQAASYCTAVYSLAAPTSGSNNAIYALNPTTGANYLQFTTQSPEANALAVEVNSNRMYYIERDMGYIGTYDALSGATTRKVLYWQSGANLYPLTSYMGSFNNNYGVIVGGAVDSNGTYWVYTSMGYIFRYDSARSALIYVSQLYYTSGGYNYVLNSTNGDIVFDSSGQAYVIAESNSTPRLWKVNLSSGAMTSPVTLTYNGSSMNTANTSAAVTGLAINPISGTMYITRQDPNGNPQYMSLNPSNGVLTLITDYSGSSLLDMTACAQPPPVAPTIAKSFSSTSASTVPATTRLTLTLNNPNSGPIFLYQALRDTLPSGMTVASTPNLNNTCTAASSNTVTASAGSSIISLNDGARLNPGSCTIAVDVTVSTPGTYTNTIVAGTSTGGLNTSSGAAGSTSATFTVTGTIDAAIQKTGPATISQNGTVTYTLRVWNNGPSAANGITINDAVPSGLTNVQWSCARTGTASCGTASGTGNSISLKANLPVDGGAAATADTNYVTITVTGKASTAGSVTNTASLAFPSGYSDTNSSNNSSSATTTVYPVVDLAAAKTVDASTVGQGGKVTYTIRVWNNGPSAVSGATFADTVPSNLTGVTWSCAATGSSTCGTASGSGNTINTTLGNLAVDTGSTTTADTNYVTFTVTGTATGATGSITNTATVTAPSGYNDSSSANNSSSVTSSIQPVADVAIQKTGTATAAINGNVTYTIRVWNNGTSTVSGAVLRDTVPSALSSVTWSCAATGTASCGSVTNGTGNTINLTLGNLPVDTGSLSTADTNYVTLTVNAKAGSGADITNTATVTAPSGYTDTNSANNSSSQNTLIGTQADLRIFKTADKTNYNVGDTVTYTIKVQNWSPSGTNANPIRIYDLVPSTLQNVTWQCEVYNNYLGYYDCDTTWKSGVLSDDYTRSGTGNTIDLQNVKTGADGDQRYFIITVTGKASQAGVFDNTATVTILDDTYVDLKPADNTSTATIAVGRVADVAISKTGTTSAAQGQNVSYQIRVWNNGNMALNAGDVTVTDTVPNLTDVTWSCVSTGTASCGATTSGSGNSIRLNLGALPVDPSTTTGPDTNYVTITVNGKAGATGSFRNSATATVNGPAAADNDTSNNTATAASTTVTPSADVQITKTGPASAAPGTQISYVLKITNNGPSAANGTTFADQVSELLTGVTATCQNPAGGASGCTATVGSDDTQNPPTSNYVTGSISTLPSGGSVEIRVTGTVPSSLTGTLNNVATVSAPGNVFEPNTANNTSSTVTTSLARAADLSITKDDGKTTIVAGERTTYTITVKNNGPSDVSGAVFADTVPSTLLAVSWTCTASNGAVCPADSGSGNSISETIATLPAGSTLTYSVAGTVNRTATGSLTNTATITAPSDVTDGTAANNSASDTNSVIPLADLGIQKVGPEQTNLNGTVTYTIKVWNQGPNPATGATITDTVPSSLTNVTWTCVGAGGATCGTASGSGNNISLSAYLPVDSNAAEGPDVDYVTLKVTGTATALGDLTNTARVSAPSSVSDTNTPNNSSSFTTAVGNNADLGITKTGPAYAKPGETMTYTLTVTNIGPQAATGVTVTDTLPDNLTYVSSTPAATVNGQTLTWTLGNLDVNGAQSITVTTQAPNDVTLAGTPAARSLINTASVSASNADPQQGNNSSSATTDMVYVQLVKSVRNVTRGTEFSTSSAGLPGEILAYCIDFKNYGGADLPNFTMTDHVPGNTVALTTAYDADESSTATGFGVRLVRGGTTSYLTSAAGDDVGTLSTSGGTFGQGTMTIDLGKVLAGETGTVCFRVTIK